MHDSCVFRVFDRAKVKLEATDSYPLEINCQLLITEEDMEEYEQVDLQQKEKLAELRRLVQHTEDGTKLS